MAPRCALGPGSIFPITLLVLGASGCGFVADRPPPAQGDLGLVAAPDGPFAADPSSEEVAAEGEVSTDDVGSGVADGLGTNCLPTHGAQDGDGDGVALACDDLVEIPAAIVPAQAPLVIPDDALRPGEAPPVEEVSLVIRGDTAAVQVAVDCSTQGSWCSYRPPFVVVGDAGAWLLEDVGVDPARRGWAQLAVSADAGAFAALSDGARTRLVRASRQGLEALGSSGGFHVEMHPLPGGSMLVRRPDLATGVNVLERWTAAGPTTEATGVRYALVEVIGDDAIVIAGRDDDRVSVGAASRDRPWSWVVDRVLSASLRARRPDVGGWLCVKERSGDDSLTLLRIHDGRAAAGQRFDLGPVGQCGFVRLALDPDGGLWANLTSLVLPPQLVRWDAATDALVQVARAGDGTPHVFSVGDGWHVFVDDVGRPQPTTHLRINAGGAAREIGVTEAVPDVRQRGALLSLVWSWPAPGSPDDPARVRVARASGFAFESAVLDMPATHHPYVLGHALAPDGTVWLDVREGDDAGAEVRRGLFSVDATGARRHMDVDGLALSAADGAALIGIGGGDAGLYRARGEALVKVAEGTAPQTTLFEESLRTDGLDAGPVWLAWPRPGGDFAIGSWAGGRLTVAVEGLLELPVSGRDADGARWLHYRQADGERLATVSGGALEVRFAGTMLRPVERQHPVGRQPTGWSGVTRRDATGDWAVCLLDGSTCIALPALATDFVVEPRMTAAGRLFAVVADPAGTRWFLWRPREVPGTTGSVPSPSGGGA